MRILLPLFLALPLAAQTTPVWVKVANENDAISVTSAQVRYGAPSCGVTATTPCWVTLPVAGKFTASNAFFKTDPAPNIVKELDVQETTTAQVVTVNGVVKQVPALPTPVVTPPVATIYTITCTASNVPNPPPTTPMPATCTAVKQ